MDELEAMARGFYGYGRWSAPYWFIGLEQGGSDNFLRAKAFKELQSDGLCDCKEFHLKIGVTDWHCDPARVQKTWGRLMMLLASFSGANSDDASLLDYQRMHWGMKDDDTCIIELSGLSAVGLHVKVDRKRYLAERIDTIRRKLAKNEPKLVVMYGLTGKKYFTQIAELVPGEVVEHRGTLFLFVDSPVRQFRGNTDAKWRKLGILAREHSGKTDFRRLVAEEIERELKSPVTLPSGKRVFSSTALGMWERMDPLRVRKEPA